MKTILNPEYGLYEKNGEPFCDSLQVAETFEKSHDAVLRDIRNVIKDVSEQFGQRNFTLTAYKNGRNRKYPKYLMTKDGYTFLAMGYTGKEAANIKANIIKRLN